MIPVVNPDGFNISREAPDAPPETEFDQFSYEMKRKNCWPNPARPGRATTARRAGCSGVDPNRNYGAFWGGSGASVDPLDDTFRGTGPFSEPETQNIRELQSTRGDHEPDHQPHVLEPDPAPAGRGGRRARRSRSRC